MVSFYSDIKMRSDPIPIVYLSTRLTSTKCVANWSDTCCNSFSISLDFGPSFPFSTIHALTIHLMNFNF